MEFGVFAQLFVPQFERDQDPQAEHKRIFRNVEIAKAADRNAFKYVWCPQHHFLDEYSHMPGPEAFLGYCAGQTERVHLGSAIFNITPPVNKPQRIAENVALLDHLTDNRFEFGTGRGSSTTEVLGFDIPSVDMTKAMWRETIREIPKMWKDAPYSYDGEFFRMPERKVFPKPNGPLHPAMWVAGGSPGTFTEAGELGLGVFCFTIGRPKDMEPLLKAYKTAIVDATPVGDYVNDNIMGVTNMLCMEDRNKAFETAVEHGHELLLVAGLPLARQRPRPKHLPEWPDKIPEPTPEQVEQLSAEGYIAVGDPDDCASAVQRWVDIGFDQLTFSPTTNTLPTEVVVGSMELFGREVIPQSSTPTPCTRPLATGARRRPSWSAERRHRSGTLRGFEGTRRGCARQLQHGRRVGDGGRRRARARGARRRRPAPDLRRARGPGQPPGPPPDRAGRRARRPRGALPRELHRVPRGHARGLEAAGRPDQRQPPLRGRRAALPARRQRLGGRDHPAVAGGRRRGGRARRAGRAVHRSSPATTTRRRSPVASSERPVVPGRGDDDHYVIYTGGTTGMPKGVVWRQDDAFYSCIGGGDPMRLHGPGRAPRRAARPHRREPGLLPAARAADARRRPVDVVLVAVRRQQGRADARIARRRRRLAGRGRPRRSNLLTVVGDAVARPLLDAWDRATAAGSPTTCRRCSRCRTAARPCRPPRCERIFATLPHVMVTDGFGSSEAGTQGAMRVAAGEGRAAASASGAAPSLVRFDQPAKPTIVVDEADPEARVAPGSGVAGQVLAGGRLPLGYHNDPEKTAATFVERDGERWLRHRRHGDGRRRRHHRAARPRLGQHQHRRREGLPRRGREHAARPTPPCTTAWSSACPTSGGAAR